jgi:hypothetical protein
MNPLPFIRLVNSERHGMLDAVLLTAPATFNMHWDDRFGPRGRSNLCPVQLYKLRGIEVPRATCRHCELERETRGRWYVAALVPRPLKEGKAGGWSHGVIQLPLQFVAENQERLTPGRRIRIYELGMGKGKPRWQLISGMVDPAELPQAFDLVAALMRITGMAELPPAASPTIAEGPADVLKFPGRTA